MRSSDQPGFPVPVELRPLMAAESVRFGIDIGGTKIHAVAFNGDHRAVAEIRRPTGARRHPDGDDPQGLAGQVIDMIDGLRTETGRRPLGGIGIGVPGVVDPERGVVRAAVNLGIGSEPLELADQVAAAFGAACRVDNDVNVAALGARQLLDPDMHDLAYLSVGTGVGVGIILGGRLRRGHAGVAGEIGHFPVEAEGPPCPCGLHGCLDVVASGKAIARLWPTPSGRSPFRHLTEAATDGDPQAVMVRHRIGRHLAAAVYLLTVTYDIGRIVVGGGVAELGDQLLAVINDGIDDLAKRSDLVRSLDLGDRVSLRPDGPVAAVGAALLLTEAAGL